MKFLSLGVVASAFAVICVSGNRSSRSGTGLSDFGMVAASQGQLENAPASFLTKNSRLSRRKLTDTISIHGYQFIKRNEKADSDAHESEEHEGEENEITGDEADEQALVSLAAVSADTSENEAKENEAKENEADEVEVKENENEAKENEADEVEVKENENEAKENENEAKENENEAKENENEVKEIEPNEDELNESGIKKQDPKESATDVVQQDVQKSETKEDTTREPSTESKHVQPEANESKDNTNSIVEEQEQESSESVINEMGMISGLYGDESEDDLVYYGLDKEDNAENIARVFQSPQEDLAIDSIPFIYEDSSEAAPSEQMKDTELVNIDAPVNAAPGYSYSVSGHEGYFEDGDEFESLQERMENEQGNKKNNIKESRV